MKTTHSKIKTVAALTLASVMGLATTEASAVILLIRTNATEQVSPGSGSPGLVIPVLVDFNGANPGGTESTFTTSAANQDVLISFHAECQGIEAVDDGDPESVDTNSYAFFYVRAQVEIDPAGPAGWQNVSPTQIFPYLCSGYGWNYSGIDAHAKPSLAGTHKVRVKIGGYFDGAIRAKSLVVQR